MSRSIATGTVVPLSQMQTWRLNDVPIARTAKSRAMHDEPSLVRPLVTGPSPTAGQADAVAGRVGPELGEISRASIRIKSDTFFTILQDPDAGVGRPALDLDAVVVRGLCQSPHDV
jgi:hypothetical protein